MNSVLPTDNLRGHFVRRNIFQEGKMSDRAMGFERPPVVYCDSIHAAGLHNGNMRMLLTRLDVDGKPMPALELILPFGEVKTMIAALQKISR